MPFKFLPKESAFLSNKSRYGWPVLALAPPPNAAMLLDFTTTRSLVDSVGNAEVTFSRGGHATMYDSTGKLTFAPNNLLTYSEDFSNASWGFDVNNTTRTSGVSDPDGGTSAWTLTASGNTSIINHTYSSVVGDRYINSVWIRRRTGTGNVSLRYPNYVDRDITSEISSTWTRIASYGNATGTTSYFAINITISGDEIDVYQPQCERVTYETTPRTYNATTSAAYYGPRFDYDPATLASRGLLVEPAAQNLIANNSDDLSTTSFNSPGGVTRTVGGGGTTTKSTSATRLTSHVGAAGHYIQTAGLTMVVSSNYTFSVEVEYVDHQWIGISIYDGGFQGGQTFDLLNGVKGSNSGATVGSNITSLGANKYRIEATFTASTTTCYIGLVMLDSDKSFVTITNSTNTATIVDCGLAQFELGSVATSYIPTTTAPVTQPAETLVMTGTDFSSWYNATEGTFVVEAIFNQTTVNPGMFRCSNSAGNAYSQALLNGGNLFANVIPTSDVASFTGPAVSSGSTHKMALAIKEDDYNAAFDGKASTPDTSGAIPASMDRIYMGCLGSGNQLNGHIKHLAYYNTRLPNATLKGVTK